jgi:hypothetical protein
LRHLAKKRGEGEILVDDSNTVKKVRFFRDENIKFGAGHDDYFEDYCGASPWSFNALPSRLFSEVITAESLTIHSIHSIEKLHLERGSIKLGRFRNANSLVHVTFLLYD